MSRSITSLFPRSAKNPVDINPVLVTIVSILMFSTGATSAQDQFVPATPESGSRISVDGVLDEGHESTWKNERDATAHDPAVRTDRELEALGIQVRADRIGGDRRLAVWSTPEVVVPGGEVRFFTYDNYDAFISSREIRLFEAGHSTSGEPLHVIAVSAAGTAVWRGGPLDVASPLTRPDWVYVLRAYDEKGRYDETEPRKLPIATAEDLARKTRRFPDSSESNARLSAYGESQLATIGIPISSGTITVSGRGLSPTARVSVWGRPVSIDADGTFVFQELMPPGDHLVDLRLIEENQPPREIQRTVEIPVNDWFFVGLADLTIGQNLGSGPARSILQDQRYDDTVYVDSRLAFFAQGRYEEKWKFTAAADTREERIQDLFKNLDEKDPFRLLRRLDPDRHYPTYGDDSLTREEAPTRGRFYARVERNDSYLLWGSFASDSTSTDFAQVDRGLYGGKLHLESDTTTSFQEPHVEIDAFGADPGTVSGRDEFRGTGGSLYYLRQQNISAGSERLRIEIRDQVTGIVLQTTELRAYDDYDVDPIQGRILLAKPLSSTADDGLVVRSGNLAGNPVYLVASYEYAPGLTDLDDYALGGRSAIWMGDHLRVGFSGSREKQQTGDLSIWGTDLTLRAGPGTYLKGEFSRTHGPGIAALNSFDGGFNFSPVNGAQADARGAQGWRLETAFDMRDLVSEGPIRGTGSAYFQRRGAGFAAPGQLAPRDVDQWGMALDFELGQKTGLRTKYDESQETNGTNTRRAEIDISRSIAKQWDLTLGVRSDESDRGASFSTFESQDAGRRTDAAAELRYGRADWELFGFGQSTLERTGDRTAAHRGGLGGRYRISDLFEMGGEVSHGTGGLGGKASTETFFTERSSIYLSYELDPDRSDTGARGGTGLLTGGTRTRFADWISVFGEERYQHGRGPVGLTHSFGVDLTPSDTWSVGFSGEVGEIDDPQQGELDRLAGTLTAGYHVKDFDIGAAIELRRDKSQIESRNTWLLRTNANYKLNSDWRSLARFNMSSSDSTQGSFFDGNFKEAVLGFAYRPVYNEKINALLKYTFFENLASPGQVARDNNVIDFKQRSHVFAIDASYDVYWQLTAGIKYAYRHGELRDARTDSGEWFRSRAHLIVLRGDWHVVHNWDVVTEGRFLILPDADQAKSGTLLAVYRHVLENFKLGVGYNFTDFSDDLTDTSFDSHGWFVNFVGKF